MHESLLPSAQGVMRTFTGRQVKARALRASDVSILDIAHSLALQCRFAGHVRQFYSVAKHSVAVSLSVPPELALWGLLHDASEAYLHDVPRPLKELPEFQSYRAAESALQTLIFELFNCHGPMPREVGAADDLLLAAEFRDLMPRAVGDPWAQRAGNYPTIQPLGPDAAERMFLHQFSQLVPGWNIR